MTHYGPVVRDIPVYARRVAVTAATVAAICLYKLGRLKEVYMKDPAFLLGRLLSLADVLHEQYCRVVRKGSVPPQLLGYQHFAMAADNARTGLAVLSGRLLVYYQWARTAKASAPEADKSIRIARWAMGKMGQISEQLDGQLPDAPLDDTGRAEMLLGYLARSEKAEEIEETVNG